MQPADVVTVQLWQVPARRLPAALRLVAATARRRPTVRGLRFAATLGTADGTTMRVRDATVRRWVVVGAWASQSAARAGLADVPFRRWQEVAEEGWTTTLHPIRVHGSWHGRVPFAVTPPADAAPRPVAALTRATVRPRRLAAFHRAVPPVAAALSGAAGLRLAVGIGELPVVRLGTFSVWETPAALGAFAAGAPAHVRAARLAGQQGWYAEALFVRFEVLGAAGTVNGQDPLAGLAVGPPW